MKEAKLIDYLDSLQEQGIPGCDCVIYKDHEEVFRHTTGFADHQMTKPLTKSNTYWLYSASKVITCTALMQLVDREVSVSMTRSPNTSEYKEMMVRKVLRSKGEML